MTFARHLHVKMLALVAALALSPAALAENYDSNDWWWDQPSANLLETLQSDGRFTTLLFALDATGLANVIANEGPFTVFAPTDDAFAALPPDLLKALVSDPDALANVLLYHVLPEKKRAYKLIRRTVSTAANGQPLVVTLEGWKVFVNDSRVINANVRASNGIAHVIDAVLIPPPEGTEINNTADLLSFDGRFETLLFALGATGLDSAVANETLTVFAPTDAAFAALPDGVLDSLVADPEALANVLLYHVTPGKRRAFSLLWQGHVPTLQGNTVDVNWYYDGLFVNDSKIVIRNLKSPNGVVHVIDAVLIPPAH